MNPPEGMSFPEEMYGDPPEVVYTIFICPFDAATGFLYRVAFYADFGVTGMTGERE